MRLAVRLGLAGAVLVAVAAVTFVLWPGGTPSRATHAPAGPAKHPSATSTGAEAPAAEPVVDGNQIIDKRDGSTFVPRGVNWSSFEYACTQGWGYSELDRLGGDAAGETEAAAIAGWGANTVRLPVNEDCWLGTRGAPVSDATTMRTPDDYRANVHRFIEALNAHGLVVILDLQSRKRVGQNDFGNLAMPDAESLAFWKSAATEYAGNPSVIFDAFNEPYSRFDPSTGTYALQLTWDCWRDGGCEAPVQDDRVEPLGPQRYQTVGMSAVVAEIRSTGARQPILLGGLDYANDLTGWLDHAPSDPQLIASFHSYPFKKCKAEACWDATVGTVATSVPVVAGEVGDTDHRGGYVNSFVSWANSHKLGWLAWVWDASPQDPMALIQSDRLTPTIPYGIRVRNLMEQR
ncbi:MAG: glycoside hydrolase, family 5 [Marmoricola sp.]|nr:glycoside hydrolase, family 5 [Marmoricola sp.]